MLNSRFASEFLPVQITIHRHAREWLVLSTQQLPI